MLKTIDYAITLLELGQHEGPFDMNAQKTLQYLREARDKHAAELEKR